MGLESFFKSSFVNSNQTINQVLKKYDSNNDKKYSEKEVIKFLDDTIKPFGTFLVGKKNINRILNKLMNKDKDGYISIKEIDDYLKTLNLSLEQLKNKDIKTACLMIDKA